MLRSFTLLLLSLCALVARPSVAQEGLVAAYSFGEGDGVIVTDSSANGNNGLVGGASRTMSGRFGAALEFNGVDALVTVNDSPSLRLSSAMTLQAWVMPSAALSGWRDVIFKAVDNYFLMASSSPSNSPAVGGTFSPTAAAAPSVLPPNTWSHLAATYDGSSLRLYVNGVLVRSQAQSGPIAQSSGTLSIGGDQTFGQFFAGLIDEVRIYNRALTQGEIQLDMLDPIPAPPPDSIPPTVSITRPTGNSTVSHVATISADASDNSGAIAVEFQVNGAAIGSDAVPPFAVPWNTNTSTNGTHTLTAIASDAAGNTASDSIQLNVVNPAFSNEVVVPDITAATTIAFLPDGRMLVGELTQTIWVVQPGQSTTDPVPFLELGSSGLNGEQGLMDIAIDPEFATNGFYYVFYTKVTGSGNHDRVSRFTASGNQTGVGSELVLWEDDVPANLDHHGGALAIGPDGMLYISTGEHFNPPDSQRLGSYRGKILRIGRDGSVPGDNPFADGAGPNKEEIWALGLRNPFRMSFDLQTGRLFIADVGGNDASTAYEEINLGSRGANYGWPLCEGSCSIPGVTSPLFSYAHLGRDASISGGFVYRGNQFPAEYQGSYFFADYVQNTIKRLVFDSNGGVAALVNFWPADGAPDTPSVGDPVKLAQGPDGALYYVDIGFNDAHVPNPAAIRRIRYSLEDQPPVAVASAEPSQGTPPLFVQFSSTGSVDPEGSALSYLWTFGDGTSSILANPGHTYPTAGRYIARLAVSDGVHSSLSDDLAITVGNPPLARILQPQSGSTFRAGDEISFSGDATDPEDGLLPPSAFSWSILFHHDTHVHPVGVPLLGSRTGGLSVPVSGHDFQDETSYEIILTVTDSSGLTGSTSVFIFPDKVDLSFDTVPSGLSLDVDGIRKVTPFVLDDIKGFQHVISAPGVPGYRFSGWSDGGAQTHSITVPDTPQRFVAQFLAAPLPAGLVAAFSFDGGSGGITSDASGNGNHGTLDGPAWTSGGRYGGALSFNGSTALVEVPDSPTLRLSEAMTLEAWIFPTTAANTWADVIFKANDNYFLMAGSPENGAPATGGTFSSVPLYAPSALPVGSWYHLAATYDGTVLRLYLNGAQIASRAQTGPIETSSLPLTIGGDAIFGQYFSGLIDEVRVYSRALTAREIATDMGVPIGDPDNDQLPFVEDNCPLWPNPDQLDADANGIGDACECGDQDGNGQVDVRDIVAIEDAIFDPSLVTPLCDTNDDAICDVSDIIGTRDKIYGAPAYCSRSPRP